MNINHIKNVILDIIPEKPVVAIILGSGQGGITSIIKNPFCIPYSNIFNHPQTSTIGHAGKWVFGYFNKMPIIIASGRFHYYEGFSLKEVTSTVLTINALDCNNLIITNAAGCLNLEWSLGDFMLIKGYLDYTFRNNSEVPDIILLEKTILYDEIMQLMNKSDINIRQGIYAWTLGPSYETSAEIKDIILNGGNAVGMSTVPELMLAQKLKMNIIGISCLTNYGSGISNEILTHKAIINITEKVKDKFSRLLEKILRIL